MSLQDDTPLEDLPDRIITKYAGESQLGLYLVLVGVTLLIYDYLLTIGEEVNLVWRPAPRISIAKLLFYLNRYFPIGHALLRAYIELQDHANRVQFLRQCRHPLLREINIWATVGNWLTMEIMLLVCVWLLWNRDRRVGATLFTLLVAGVSLGTGLRNTKPPKLPSPTLPPLALFPCGYWPPTGNFWYYTSALCIQGASASLYLKKTVTVWRTGTLRSTRLVSSAVARYGILYYAVAMMLTGVSLASSLVEPIFVPLTTAQLLTPCMSVLCNRLGLSMRHALFNTTFIGTDAGKETGVTLSARHEATKDTIEMLLQTVPDAQSPQILTPYDDAHEPQRESPIHALPKEDGHEQLGP